MGLDAELVLDPSGAGITKAGDGLSGLVEFGLDAADDVGANVEKVTDLSAGLGLDLLP